MLGKQLFWFESASDEFLEWLYQHSSALLCASEGEGFGLPLIEAARMGLPIIARDLPVFKEVAKEGAYYFSVDEAKALASALQVWLDLYEQNTHPRSSAIKPVTWHDSATDLMRHLLH
jgi:glycosyltransferase involved in cell wall biosynthesis